MKGRAPRIKGVERKSDVARLGFSAALDMADVASERTASEDCLAVSRARAGGILWAKADIEVSVELRAVYEKYVVLWC